MSDELPQFRTFLNTIANELISDELDELKYLCYPRLTNARLQKVNSPQQLFVAISEVICEEDGQLIWLKELLRDIRRLDLEKRIETFLKLRISQDSHREHFQAASTFRNGEFADSRVSTAVSTSDASGNRSQPQEIDSRDIAQPMVNSSWAVPFMPSSESERSSNGMTACAPDSNSQKDGLRSELPRASKQIYRYPQYSTSQPVETESLRERMTDHFQPGSSYSSQHTRSSSVKIVNSDNQKTLSGQLLTNASQPLRQIDSSLAGIDSGQTSVASGYLSQPRYQTDSGQLQMQTIQDEATREFNSQSSVPFGQEEQFPFQREAPSGHQPRQEEQLPFQREAPSGHQPRQEEQLTFQREASRGHQPRQKEQLPFQREASRGHPPHQEEQLPLQREASRGHPPRQEEQLPFQREATGGHQPQQGQFQALPLDTSDRGYNHSSFKDKAATENAHLIPSSSMDSEGTGKSHAQEHLRCPREMTYREMEDFFRIGSNRLGEGRFGTVYKGCKKFHGKDVVVKVQHWTTYGAAQLKRETIVGFIKHPNLMPLYAICEEKRKPRCLMYPLMHCDLQKALHKDFRGKMTLPWECRVRIALHTLRGLQYLHSRVLTDGNARQGIVHMNIKPSNIFLDYDLNARLGDAGTMQKLPVAFSDGYLDPYLNDTHFKPINDLFSFGIVLLQLLTQREALEPRTNVKLWQDLQDKGALLAAETLIKTARSSIWFKTDPAKQFCAIAINCLKKPDERAKLLDVCKTLEEILEEQEQELYVSPKDGHRCASCLLNVPAKYLGVKSPRCDSQMVQSCNHFCVTCLTEVQRNPVECPVHGPAQPPIGRNNTYAVLVCGDDSNNQRAAAAFRRDVSSFRNTLTDNRIIGVRLDHLYCITPSSCESSVGTEVKRKLQLLEEELQGKNDVFLYFYFTGHSDKKGNLLCSSGVDLLNEADLQEHFERLRPYVEEFIIILDCCFADGNITSKPLDNNSFLVSKSENATTDTTETPIPPLDSLFNLPNQTYAGEEIDFDSFDGAVMNKSPPQGDVIGRPGTFNVRQWSSSLSQQESFAMRKGSFFTKFLICGLRGAHECSFSNCFICKKFQDKAKAVGYISAEDLENYISEHVMKTVQTYDRHQIPRMRALHSKETVLAYYNGEKLCDEIKFKAASGSVEMILVNKFQTSLVEFQSYVISNLQGKLPPCSKGKHLQLLCDGEEVDSTSFHGVMNFARQGYDVKCQMRPCSSIDKGPVMVEIQNANKVPVESFFDSLGLEKHKNMEAIPHFSFLADTFDRTYTDYDVDETLDEIPTLRESLDESLLDSITVMLKTASLHKGSLTIHVYEDHLDCELEISNNISM